jgi:uncharacterized protein YkwD
MRRTVFCLCVSLLSAGCAAVSPPPSVPDPQTQMAALAGRIAVLVQAERLKLDPNAKPLSIDPELTKIAQEWSRDMAIRNDLAHVAPNGDTSASLLMAEDASWQGLLGENLAAQHYVKASGVDVEVFARRFLDEWVQSDPHRENLADPAYDRTGVGAAINGDTVYVTELFANAPGTRPAADSPASTMGNPPSASGGEAKPPVDVDGSQAGAP